MTGAGAALSDVRAEVIRQSFARSGFMMSMDACIVTLDPGRCVLEMPFSDRVIQQHGFFHGGAVGALADAAGGYAAMTMAPDGNDVLTLEYKINFLRPALGERIIAEGVVLRAGRNVIVTRVDVFSCEGMDRVLCAALQQSIMPARTHRR
jgi:uncharacterized protein (TIGR00369 family)